MIEQNLLAKRLDRCGWHVPIDALKNTKKILKEKYKQIAADNPNGEALT